MRYRLTKIGVGILRRDSDGMLFVRVDRVNPKTGEEDDTTRVVPRKPEWSPREYQDAAVTFRSALLTDIVHTVHAAGSPHQRFKDYARVRIDQKFNGTIIAASTKDKYDDELKRYLDDRWGAQYIDKIEMHEVRAWMSKMGAMVSDKKYTPHTVNSFWQLFKWIMADAAIEFRIPNPCERIPGISLSLHRTYSLKAPNSLELDEVVPFFKAAREVGPDHFAYFLLGMFTGRRACELRPIRIEGEDADLDWSSGMLQVRRSQVGIHAPNERLKQKKDVMAVLPKYFLETFKQHKGDMPWDRRHSDLLFPPFVTTKSGYMHKNGTVKVLKEICKKAKIKKHLSDRFMRRTFYAIGDGSRVDNKVLKAISGHHTEKSRELYSHIAESKSRAALSAMLKWTAIEGI